MPVAPAQGGRDLLDVERDAVRAVVQDVDDVVGELLAGHRGGEQRRVGALERPQRQLERLADPAQLAAQAAKPVRVGRHLVARDRDEQERHVAQPGRDAGEQQEGGLVGPVEVVEHDRGGTARGHLRECAAQRLDERRLARVERGQAELRQQRSEVRGEPPARLRDLRGPPHALPEGLRDRVVRLGDRRARAAAERQDVRLGERVAGEARLADAGLARDQHEPPRPSRAAAHAAASASSSSRLPIMALFPSTPRV